MLQALRWAMTGKHQCQVDELHAIHTFQSIGLLDIVVYHAPLSACAICRADQQLLEAEWNSE